MPACVRITTHVEIILFVVIFHLVRQNGDIKIARLEFRVEF